jgi:hypothetical protein
VYLSVTSINPVFLRAKSGESGIIWHILPRHQQAIAFVENRRILGGNIIDFGKLVNFFDDFGLAGNDQRINLRWRSAAARRLLKLVLMPPEFLVVIIGDVN